MSVTIAKVHVVATPLHLQVYCQTPAREGNLRQRCRRSPRNVVVAVLPCMLFRDRLRTIAISNEDVSHLLADNGARNI